MRAVEQAPRDKKQKERRAKPARRSFAFHSPRPQLLKDPTKESMSSKPKPSDGDFVAAIRGSVADAFFGASPVVASALGIRSGATPRGRIHSKPHPSALPRKEDISTLLGIGHFYFALTGANGTALNLRYSRLNKAAGAADGFPAKNSTEVPKQPANPIAAASAASASGSVQTGLSKAPPQALAVATRIRAGGASDKS
jgi:hypothetical protein